MAGEGRGGMRSGEGGAREVRGVRGGGVKGVACVDWGEEASRETRRRGVRRARGWACMRGAEARCYGTEGAKGE